MPVSFFARLAPSMHMNGYNFTERVRRTLAASREEAFRLHHEYVGTEHILLALLRDPDSIAVTALGNLGVDRHRVAAMIEEVVKPGNAVRPAGAELPYTSRAKKVLELAMTAARDLNHSYVGTEHLIIGLVDEQKGIAAQVLIDQGLTTERLSAEIARLLGPERRGDAAPAAPDVPPPDPHREPTPQQIAAEQLAWTRLGHALDVCGRLGTTPSLDLADDGVLTVSFGPTLVLRIAFPPTVVIERRSAAPEKGD